MTWRARVPLLLLMTLLRRYRTRRRMVTLLVVFIRVLFTRSRLTFRLLYSLMLSFMVPMPRTPRRVVLLIRLARRLAIVLQVLMVLRLFKRMIPVFRLSSTLLATFPLLLRFGKVRRRLLVRSRVRRMFRFSRYRRIFDLF